MPFGLQKSIRIRPPIASVIAKFWASKIVSRDVLTKTAIPGIRDRLTTLKSTEIRPERARNRGFSRDSLLGVGSREKEWWSGQDSNSKPETF